MLNREALLNMARGLIVQVTGISDDYVYNGNPNANIAENAKDTNGNRVSYITVNVTGTESFGQASIGLTPSSETVTDPELGVINRLDQTTRTVNNVTFSLNFFQLHDSFNYASFFDNEPNKRPPVMEYLRSQGVGWRSVGPLNDLTALQNHNYELRYQRNLFLYVDNRISDIINPIYRVPYQVQNEESTILNTGEVILE